MGTCPKCNHTLVDEADRCDACGLDVAAVRIAVRQAVAELRPALRTPAETMEYRPQDRWGWLLRFPLVIGMLAMILSAVVNFILALQSLGGVREMWVPLLLFASAVVSVGFAVVFALALDYCRFKAEREEE